MGIGCPAGMLRAVDDRHRTARISAGAPAGRIGCRYAAGAPAVCQLHDFRARWRSHRIARKRSTADTTAGTLLSIAYHAVVVANDGWWRRTARLPTSPSEPPVNQIEEEVSKRRSFAIISHPDAGKTTLTEKLLLYGGAIHVAGQVSARKRQRQAASDWMALERER